MRFVDLTKRFFSGDFLIKHGLEKLVPFAIYICLWLVIDISWSLYVEKTLTRQEHLEKEVSDLKIEYTHKDLELTGFNQRTKVEQMLEAEGSDLHEPVEPAGLIELKK